MGFFNHQRYSHILIATKLDAENTTLLDSYIQFYIFTNISGRYTKYATLKKLVQNVI